MKKKILTILKTSALATILSLSCIMPVFAADSSSSVVTGGVGVKSNTYIYDDEGKLTNEEGLGLIYPGQLLNYKIEVENNAMSAYVRTKVDITGNIDFDTFGMIKGVSPDWMYTNGYYYYKKPVATGESVTLSTGLKLPDNNNIADSNMSVKINSDAVQSENFKPDFEAEDPWGGMTIEKGKAAGIMYSEERFFDINKSSEFSGVISADRILGSTGNLMPGDVVKDSVDVKSNNHAIVSIMASYGDAFPKEAEYMTLSIDANGTPVYNGSLFSKELRNGLIIGEFSKGAATKLNFTLKMDTRITNESAWLAIPVSFTINGKSLEEVVTPTPTATPIPKTPTPTVVYVTVTPTPTVAPTQAPSPTYIYNYYIDDSETTEVVNYTTAGTPAKEETTPAQAVLGALRDVPEKGVLGAVRTNIQTGDEKMAFAFFVGSVLAIIIAIVTACVMFTRKKEV